MAVVHPDAKPPRHGTPVTEAPTSPAADLAEQVGQLLAADSDDWQVTAAGFWCTATPTDARPPGQGWKIHVSATPVSAGDVLAGAVPVLRSHHTAFKVASDLDAVRWLTGRDCDRALAGKVLTVYPADDGAFGALVEALHDAVGRLPGPRILSDRPYLPGSSVHYRYGGFSGAGELDSDGVYRYQLTRPDGSRVEDARGVWFDAPPWAPCPLDPEPATPRAEQPQGRSGGVLLGDRFVVRAALRHSAKGGVYLATDKHGGEAVVKHARAHTEADASGRDARDLLRNEEQVLRRLHGTAPVPGPLSLFEQDGDVFLAEERLLGTPLRAWVQHASKAAPGVAAEDAWPVATALTEAVAAVHDAGYVLRDLSPSNVLVADDGGVALVDVELATPVGADARRSGTPSYQAPEQHGGGERSPVAFAEDLYSLGGLLFLLATGCDPLLPDRAQPGKTADARLVGWLDLTAEYGDTAAWLFPWIRELLAAAPDDRPGLCNVKAFLHAETGARPVHRRALTAPTPVQLLDDGIGYLLDTMSLDQPRPWPTGPFGRQTDPGNVQHGAAGVLTALTIAAPYASDRDAVTRAVRAGADWLVTQHPARPLDAPLPGLYFGRAGVAWALADVADLLYDTDLRERAYGAAAGLPLDWPNPDVAHGLAGALLAHLRLAAATGEQSMRDRGDHYANALARRAATGEHGPHWQILTGFDSRLAGQRHHGFAHGTAGVGYALLAAGREPDVELAVRAGDALCRVAELDRHGGAWWPVGPGDPTKLPHWCSGSSGVGTFLLRLYARTGEQRFADLAAAAAIACHRSRWQSSPANCHGLAGDGQFLLDAAAILLEPTYHEWAADLADCLAVRHGTRNGRYVVADETGRDVVADYQVGTAGVVAFLARLLHGGPRPFMLDVEVARC